MINYHYLNRYNTFINTIKHSSRVIIGYSENHHIQPRCLQGSDDKSNMIELTLREHFIAHWLLWKAYPDYFPIASAFLQMVNKNPKLKKNKSINTGRVNSKSYTKLKSEVYDHVSKFNTNKVYVRDDFGELICLTKEEFKNSDYRYHTKGRIHQYNPDAKYAYNDIKSNRILKITRLDANRLNKKFGYKRLVQVVNSKIKVTVNDQTMLVTPEEYNPTIHKHFNVGNVTVVDKDDQCTKKISLTEYNKNKDRYVTNSKGMVLAKDNSTGQSKFISKEDYISGNYSGQTKGMTTVRNTKTGVFEQISVEDFLANKDTYAGPCTGKVNARNKITGEMRQISKVEFNNKKDLWAGASFGVFKIKHSLTGEVRRVTIWDNLKSYNDDWVSMSKKYKLK